MNRDIAFWQDFPAGNNLSVFYAKKNLAKA
jgi:hypothetical protein